MLSKPRRKSVGSGAAARSSSGPSDDGLEQTMQKPVTFRAASNGFFGDERSYTRQRLYRTDDVDLQARFHPSDGAKMSAANLDEDPYAEAGYVGVEEQPDAVEQFRSDIADDRFLHMIQRNREVPDPTMAIDGDTSARTHPTTNIVASYEHLRLAREREARTRTEVLRAMERSQRQQSLFTVEYAACVGTRYAEEFLYNVEAGSVCAALVPMLLVRRAHLRYHLSENQLRRILFDVGCHLERSETRRLKGHMRQHVPLPPAENGWYTEDQLDDEHTHYNETTDTTVMRVLTFQIETPAASTEDALLRDPSDAAGYRVKVVAHLVDEDRDDERRNVLCFRTFHFSRYA